MPNLKAWCLLAWLALGSLALAGATTNAVAQPSEAAEQQSLDWNNRITAEIKAGRGKACVPDLIRVLNSPGGERENAALMLGDIGPDAREAVPALTQHVNDPDFMLSLRSIQGLAGIGPDAAPAIPVLEGALNNESWNIVDSALWTLGSIGPKAQDALPKIEPFLQLPKNSYRYSDLIVAARVAIARITGKPGKQFLPLMDMLDEKNDDSIDSFPATCAMEGLIALKPGTRIAIPKIGEMLLDPKLPSITREDAARALASFGDPKASEYLQKAIHDDTDSMVRYVAIESLKKLVPATDNVQLVKASEQRDYADTVKRLQPFNDKLKPLTSELPPVTSVEIFRLASYSVGDKGAPQPPSGAEIFPMNPDGYTLVVTGKVTLKEKDAEKLAGEWRQLDFGVQYQALCHFPVYALKFMSGDRVLLQTTICWHCSDFSLADGGYGGFNSAAESAKILKNHLEKLLPPKQK